MTRKSGNKPATKPAAAKTSRLDVAVAVNRIIRGAGKDEEDIVPGTVFRILNQDERQDLERHKAIREPSEAELALFRQRASLKAEPVDEKPADNGGAGGDSGGSDGSDNGGSGGGDSGGSDGSDGSDNGGSGGGATDGLVG